MNHSGKLRITILLISIFLYLDTYGQSAYVHISNQRIYDFLDEMASERRISLNSTVKPYTRLYIYNKLKEVKDSKSVLNNRQQKELDYYLDYFKFGSESNYLPSLSKLNLFKKSANSSTSLNHLAYFYSDSLFNFSLRPILGFEYFTNSSGNYSHTFRGLEGFASVGKHLTVYADLRDNTVNRLLVLPKYFTKEMGGIYKTDVQKNGGADFSEMRGGILLSWSFLEVGIIKDHLVWGDNYNGAIIYSGRTPSFPMIKLHIHPVKWFDFNYFHAWLISDVIDSSLTYVLPNGHHRNTFRNKFMAANMFTITPIKGLNLSLGNSIIYSDQNVNPAYLIPVFFYKSVDHTLTSYQIENQNSQFFLDFSVRLIKHTHLFFTAFYDEFAANRVSDPNTHNFYSFKAGTKLSNWPVKNISITAEYFRSVPITYKHYVPTLTYESNSFNLGPYLRDNSEEIFFSIDLKPISRLFASYSYTNARHGNEYNYIDGFIDVTYPILKDNTWTNISHSFVCSYEILTNCHITLEYLISSIKGYDVDGQSAEYYLNRFTPKYFQGNKNTFMVRCNIGF
jgi:hypothetical protein